MSGDVEQLASPADAPVQGYCDPRFAAVREQFQQNFVDRSETGAALAVTLNGEVVIDLYGGWTNAKHSKAWADDTIVCCYSVGKAIGSSLITGLSLRNRAKPRFPSAGSSRIRRGWWRFVGHYHAAASSTGS